MERPTVVTDAGPQGGCPSYCKDPENFAHPDQAPEECQKLYQEADDLCLFRRPPLPRYEPGQQEIPTPVRTPLEVDCSEHFVEGNGFNPDAVPSLCRDPYISWWNANHEANPDVLLPDSLSVPTKDDLRVPLNLGPAFPNR